MTPLYYIERPAVMRVISMARYDIGAMSYEEELDQWLLASLFMTKVFSECKALGIYPQEPRIERSATGEPEPIDLMALMYEAEEQLGFTVSVRSNEPFVSKWRSRTAEYVADRRRRFAMSVFLRMTSGGIIK